MHTWEFGFWYRGPFKSGESIINDIRKIGYVFEKISKTSSLTYT